MHRFIKEVFKTVVDISKQLNRIKDCRLGIRYALEENKTKDKVTDTLTPKLISFDTYVIVFKVIGESKKNKYGVTFFTALINTRSEKI